MLKRSWLLVAFVYLLFAEALSWLPVPDSSLCLIQAEHGEKVADSDGKKCPAFHVGAALAFDQANTFLESHDKSVVGGFTIVLAISTIGLWLATNKLWAAGERQLNLLEQTSAAQSRDMQASIKVAQDSAKAAKRSAEFAEAAIVATDRAWISITPKVIGPLVFGKDSITIDVGFNIENIGRSPATHVQFWAELCCDVIEAREKGEEAARVYGSSILNFGRVMFPSDPWEYNQLEMAMETVHFMRVIEDAKARAAEDKDADWDGSRAYPAISACVTYRLAGSHKSHHTMVLFEIASLEKKDSLGWDGSEGTTDLIYLKLIQTFLSGQAN